MEACSIEKHLLRMCKNMVEVYFGRRLQKNSKSVAGWDIHFSAKRLVASKGVPQ